MHEQLKNSDKARAQDIGDREGQLDQLSPPPSTERELVMNPFAFGASGRPLSGPESFVHRFLSSVYTERQQVIEGPREQILDGIEAYLKEHPSDGRWSRREMNRAIDDLLSSKKNPALLVEEENMIKSSEDFGIMYRPKQKS